MKSLLSIALLGSFLALGCSSRKVNFDYDRSADFSSYKTLCDVGGATGQLAQTPMST